MFNDCVLLALMVTDDKTIKVCRIAEDEETQNEIDASFETAFLQLTKNRSPVEFDGKYSPNEDSEEYLFVDHFSLPKEIENALVNPLGLEVYEPIDSKLPAIKALFVGEHYESNGQKHFTAAFQKFKNEQYITQAKHHLFFSNNTFKKQKKLGISVSRNADCIYQNGELQFTSYYYARQIFDLSNYYREATTQEVANFLSSSIIAMDRGEDFILQANSWERKKIASINDSGVLNSHTADEIKKIAQSEGLDVLVENKKIVLPTDKKDRRVILGFLDEEVYKGVFSNELYQTNSKRKAK